MWFTYSSLLAVGKDKTYKSIGNWNKIPPASKGLLVIEPGREKEIRKFLSPHIEGKKIYERWIFENTDIQPDSIIYKFREKNVEVYIILHHKNSIQKPFLQSKNFDITFSTNESARIEDIKKLVKYVSSLIITNDKGKFWKPRRGIPQRCPVAFWGHDTLVLKLILLLHVIFLPFFIKSSKKALSKIRKGEWIYIILLVFVGFILRGFLSPKVPGRLGRPFGVINLAISGAKGCDYYGYGKAFYAFYNILFEIFPKTENTIYLGNSVLGSLSIFLTYTLSYLLLQSNIKALATATLLTFLPLHIKMSSTEILLILGIFFGLISMVAFLVFSHTDKMSTLIFGALSLFFTLHTRPEMWIFPAIILLLALANPLSLKHFKRFEIWLIILVFIILTFPSVYLTYKNRPEMNWQESTLIKDILNIRKFLGLSKINYCPPGGFNSGNIFLNTFITPFPLILLASLGIIVLFFQNRRILLFLLLSALLFTNQVISIPGLMNAARLQLPAQVFFVLLAGAGLGWLGEISIHYFNYKVAFLIILITSFIIYLIGYPFINKLWTLHKDYLVFKTGIKKIPSGCILVQLVNQNSDHGIDLPIYLSEAYKLNHLWINTADLLNNKVEPDKQCIVYYQSSHCFNFDLEEIQSIKLTKNALFLRPECMIINERYKLLPIFIKEIEAERYECENFLNKEFPVGFYRVSIKNSGSQKGMLNKF